MSAAMAIHRVANPAMARTINKAFKPNAKIMFCLMMKRVFLECPMIQASFDS